MLCTTCGQYSVRRLLCAVLPMLVSGLRIAVRVIPCPMRGYWDRGRPYVTTVQHNMGLFATQCSRHRKTSIICTVGKRGEHPGHIAELVESGMDIMRLNMSHADPEEIRPSIDNLRRYIAGHNAAATHDAHKRVVGIALDTQGPEIRTGMTADREPVHIASGSHVLLRADPERGNTCTGSEVYVDYAPLAQHTTPGSAIFIDDGALHLEVLSTDPERRQVHTVARNSVLLGSRKGVNLPGVVLDLPVLSPKDLTDLRFAAEQKLDYVFASFIRRPEDVQQIREVVRAAGHGSMQVIAKIECQEALDSFDAILQAADGVMVARGDLGVEIPAEKVFLAQKMMISKANVVGKPVICATQMLESMVARPSPTRAECSDVANAVIDGADCVMLSAETSKGQYHQEAVRIMDRVCRQAEAALSYKDLSEQVRRVVFAGLERMRSPDRVRLAWAASAVDASFQHESSLIVGLAKTGEVARLISQFRPRAHLLLAVPDEALCRRLLLYHGIRPVHTPQLLRRDSETEVSMIHHLVEVGKRQGICQKGGVVVGVHKEYLQKDKWISLLKFLHVE